MAVTRSKRGERAERVATRIAVLGGGVSGLAAAFYARREYPEAEVVVLEASERFGGTVRTVAKDGFVLDLGPDALLTRKPAGLELCRILGLEHRLIARNPEGRAVYVRRNGELRRLPASMRMFVPLDESELRASGVLSAPGAARVFRGPLTAATGPGSVPGRRAADDESIEAFFSRRFGAEMYRYLAEPLTAGILGGDGSRLSMAANFGELVRLEREHGQIIPALRERFGGSAPPAGAAAESKAGSIAEQPAAAAAEKPLRGAAEQPAGADVFRSFPGGMCELTGALEEALREDEGCRLELNSRVAGIARGGRTVSPDSGLGAPAAGRSRWRVERAGGGSVEADAVICALPAYAASRVISSIDPELAPLLAETVYSRAAAVFLAIPTEAVAMDLSGSGYLVPRAEGGIVTACTWSSRKWPGRAPQGYELLRVFMAPPVGADRDAPADSPAVDIPGRGEPAARDASTPADAFEALTDGELIERALGELRETLGIRAEPRLAEVWRWDCGVANYTLGHLERRAEIERRLQQQSGLVAAGSALYGVGIPDCIRSAREAVDRLGTALAGLGTAI